MRAEHYVYFALKSERMPAAEMTNRLGIEPDKVSVRGSKRVDPPRPAVHIWAVECREADLRVDEQIARVLERLWDAADRIDALAAELDRLDQCPGSAVLQVVRFYEDDDPADLNGPGLPAQPNLLGWHLDTRVISFLARTHAELDIDEYSN